MQHREHASLRSGIRCQQCRPRAQAARVVRQLALQECVRIRPRKAHQAEMRQPAPGRAAGVENAVHPSIRSFRRLRCQLRPKIAAVANSTPEAWLLNLVFWQNCRVSCDPNRAEATQPTEKAPSSADLTPEPSPTAAGSAHAPTDAAAPSADVRAAAARADCEVARPREIGGREGPDPTRYGDWELRGRCIDF